MAAAMLVPRATWPSRFMSIPPNVLVTVVPTRVLVILFITQNRGPLSRAKTAPLAEAMALASRAANSAWGQVLSGYEA